MSVGPVRILIADDDRRVRQLLKSILHDLKAEFMESGDGHEAVAAYFRHQPDWVLMDLQMPGLDGISAARQIIKDFPQARILIVTQFEGAQFRQAAREAGACGYVLKDDLLLVRDFILGRPNPGIPQPPPNAGWLPPELFSPPLL